MIAGLLVFVIAALVVMVIEQRLTAAVRDIPVSNLAAEHGLLPLLRIACIVAFLCIAYPDIYGLQQRNLPPLGDVLFRTEGRISTLLNIMFISGIFLPFIPALTRFSAVVLPLQALIGSLLLFSWTANALDVPVRLWIGPIPLIAVIVLAVGAHLAAAAAARLVPQTSTMSKPLYDALILLMQLPPILVYTFPLGQQLKGLAG